MNRPSTPLWRLAKLVRSKNAGPFMITIDVMFDDAAVYKRVKSSGVLSCEVVAELFDLPPDRVNFAAHDAALSLKVSLPRRRPAGSIGDTDVFGGQFHGPLVDLAIPDPL